MTHGLWAIVIRQPCYLQFRFDLEKLTDTDKYNIQTLRCRINMQQDAVGKDSAKRRRIGKLQRK